MTTRRGFLAAALAACAAPAYVKAGILMPVTKVWAPDITDAEIRRLLGNFVAGRCDQIAAAYLDATVYGIGFYEGTVWTPDQIAAMPRRQPLVVNQIRPIVRRWLDSAEAEAMFRRTP